MQLEIAQKRVQTGEIIMGIPGKVRNATKVCWTVVVVTNLKNEGVNK